MIKHNNMKKQLLLCGIAALAFCSCSNDETIESANLRSSQITFSPSVGNMSRAVTTVNNLDQFTVNAYLNQGDAPMYYIKDLNVKKESGVWTSAQAYTWPYSGQMTFFSYSPADLSVNMPASAEVAAEAPTITYTASSNPERQKDLLYAVNVMDAAKAYAPGSNSTTVNVNFRHALSQVVFSAKNTNPGWILDISDVQIVNIKSKGVYTFPTQTTAPFSADGDVVRGSWALENVVNSYSASFSAATSIGAEAVELTSSSDGALLVLPQTAAAWDPATDPSCQSNGCYFMVRCKIQQITPDGNALLWPSKSTDTAAYVAIPVNIDWQEGKKYTYTFIFGDGAGFIPPTSTEGGETVIPGSTTLAKINFSVSVDDFQEAGNKNMEM